jgi:hypothetical protein
VSLDAIPKEESGHSPAPSTGASCTPPASLFVAHPRGNLACHCRGAVTPAGALDVEASPTNYVGMRRLVIVPWEVSDGLARRELAISKLQERQTLKADSRARLWRIWVDSRDGLWRFVITAAERVD